MSTVIDYHAQLDQSLAKPNFSEWNHTSLKSAAALVAGYEPIDGAKLVSSDIREKAAKLLDRYLIASHYYHLMPGFLLTAYGKEFRKLRRIAYRILAFYRNNPTFAIPMDTIGAWTRAEGLPWTP